MRGIFIQTQCIYKPGHSAHREPGSIESGVLRLINRYEYCGLQDPQRGDHERLGEVALLKSKPGLSIEVAGKVCVREAQSRIRGSPCLELRTSRCCESPHAIGDSHNLRRRTCSALGQEVLPIDKSTDCLLTVEVGGSADFNQQGALGR